MKQRTGVVLLATFVSVGAWGQDVSAFSTTMVQVRKQDTPGFPTATLAPATEFLGIDASGLGIDALTLHLYGWGYKDLADASMPRGKSGGDLSYAYLEYRFGKANAQLKAGRFSISQGGGVEQVDGVSGRTDLKGGFNLSAFAGAPVHYRTAQDSEQSNYNRAQDIIFGSRLGLRLGPVGELGVSYLQEGSKAPKDLSSPPVDYTRKQVGTDLRLAPAARLELNGHTLFNVASQYQAPGSPALDASKVAEHDYTASYRFSPTVALNGNYTERNLEAYYAGTNLPNLFRLDEKDKHKAMGGSLLLSGFGATDVTVDFRHIKRDSYGNSNRFGFDLRWAVPEAKVRAGGGLHKVNASDALVAGPASPSFYGLSRSEARAWVMVDRGKVSCSLDGIFYHFDDAANPNLNGKASMSQLVGSVGIHPTENLAVSGDLSCGTNALYQNETSVLLRTTYRFTVASKGGSK